MKEEKMGDFEKLQKNLCTIFKFYLNINFLLMKYPNTK